VVLPIRDDNPTSRTPYITLLLIAVNLFVYFAVQPHSGTDASQRYLYEHAAIPCEITGGEPITGVPAFGQFQSDLPATKCIVGTNLPRSQVLFPHKNVYVGALESMFMHGSVAHVLGNMLFLWIFGNNVEDRLRPLPFLIFYLAAGLIATAVFIALNWNSTVPLVGASGAIAGVMGAYLIWFPRTRVLSLIGFFPVYLPAVFVLGRWFVMQFATNPNEGVAWQAHVGGFVFGAIVAFLLRPMFGNPRPRRAVSPYDDWDGGFRGGYPGRL
jgi:membrane associated rhomboid family serine protease